MVLLRKIFNANSNADLITSNFIANDSVMKTKFILLSLLTPSIALGQWCDPYHFGTLRSTVYNDSVVLRDDTAIRNCASHYIMQVNRTTNDTLEWLQVDQGGGAGCECHFNLTATVDSLSPGHYSAKVYYTNYNMTIRCYVGMIDFDVTQPLTYSSLGLASQFQSQCFKTTWTEEQLENVSNLILTPNPARNSITLQYNHEGLKKITIYNLTGECVHKEHSYSNLFSIDLRLMPSSIYYISIENDGTMTQSKFIKL